MNATKALKHWNDFKKSFPKVELHNRLMHLNFEFGLDSWFHKDDLEKMKKHLDNAIKAVTMLEQETQK